MASAEGLIQQAAVQAAETASGTQTTAFKDLVWYNTRTRRLAPTHRHLIRQPDECTEFDEVIGVVLK